MSAGTNLLLTGRVHSSCCDRLDLSPSHQIGSDSDEAEDSDGEHVGVRSGQFSFGRGNGRGAPRAKAAPTLAHGFRLNP